MRMQVRLDKRDRNDSIGRKYQSTKHQPNVNANTSTPASRKSPLVRVYAAYIVARERGRSPEEAAKEARAYLEDAGEAVQA